MIPDISKNLNLHPSWKSRLSHEFTEPYWLSLCEFLEKEKNKNIFPKRDQYFAALNLTPFEKVKVVLIGQDPYHGQGQAHGLCFSVPKGISLPPSLKNIFKELQSDLGIPLPNSGTLTPWAAQGVLLLNSVLTVEEGLAGSHQGRGWEVFTDRVIAKLNAEREGLIYVLWGSYAQKKGSLIDRKKNFVLESAHPSPLSSYRGFFGSKPFSKINKFLQETGNAPLEWNLESLSQAPFTVE